MVSEALKGQNDKAAEDRSNFAQLGKELEKWVQSHLNESQPNGSVLVKPTDEQQEENPAIDRTWKSDQGSMAKVLDSLVHDDQQPRREESRGFSMEVEQKVERKIALRFPKNAKLLLENQSLSRKERWSRWKHQDSSHGSMTGEMVATVEEELVIHSNIRGKKVFMYRCTSV